MVLKSLAANTSSETQVSFFSQDKTYSLPLTWSEAPSCSFGPLGAPVRSISELLTQPDTRADGRDDAQRKAKEEAAGILPSSPESK